jgi:hypothetical protein
MAEKNQVASKRSGKSSSIPKDLDNIATMDSVSTLSERVEKCYSSERYQAFSDSVKEIVLQVINTNTTGDIIKAYAKQATKDFLEENNWKKIQFWLPTTIAIISVIISVIKD